MKSFFKKIFLAAIPLCVSASVVQAAGFQQLNLKMQTSKYMGMGQQVKTIAVADPTIATVVQVPGSASEFLVVAKAVKGSTTMFVWTIDGARHEYLIVVSPEDQDQAKIIEEAIGLRDVHVKYVDDRLLLTGTVKNQYEKNRALQIARLYVNAGTESSLLVGSGFDMKLETKSSTDKGNSGNVEASKTESSGAIIDLLQILNPTQILLEAQIIEINSDDAKDLGLDIGRLSGDADEDDIQPGIIRFGESSPRTNAHTHFKNNPIKWAEQHFELINVKLNALVENGKARILSRPSVTTLSGEQATIQIGGEIPYTVRNSYGWSTEFKDYGIILQVKPVVDAQGRINSAIHAEVSNMNGETSDGQIILATRSADSVISLQSGMPIVIGGLMDSSETKRVQKIPLLGDIPILGEFFKHTSKSRDKRELIIVVTPYLVEGDEISSAPMSEKMSEWYDEQERLREAMQRHDFKENTSTPPSYQRTTDEPFK